MNREGAKFTSQFHRPEHQEHGKCHTKSSQIDCGDAETHRRRGLQPWPEAAFLDTLNLLQDRGVLTREVSTVFHDVRKNGNRAVHEHGSGITHGDALHQLKMLRALAVWFHRAFRDPQFKPGPFVPPTAPEDATTALEEELAHLRAKVDVAMAQAESEQEARRLAEAKAREIAEEREVWQSLAEESEARLAEADLHFQKGKKVPVTLFRYCLPLNL